MYVLSKQECRIFYNGMEWRNMNSYIKDRDNYECQECKRSGKVSLDIYEKNKNDRKKIKLVVHHIKELKDYPELALDENNLETLCVDCHNKIHGRNFKTNFKYREPKWKDETW